MTFWSIWKWGQKDHGGVFLLKLLVKKVGISCNVWVFGNQPLQHLVVFF
jgi:hypothetical protein